MTVLFGQFGFCCSCHSCSISRYCLFDRTRIGQRKICKGNFFHKPLFWKLHPCSFQKRRNGILEKQSSRKAPIIILCTLNACLPENNKNYFSKDKSASPVNCKENTIQVNKDDDSEVYEMEENEDSLNQEEDEEYAWESTEVTDNYSSLELRDYLVSQKLAEYLETKHTEEPMAPEYPLDNSAILDWWVAAVDSKKFKQVQNLYGNFGIFFLDNFPDFTENRLYQGKLTARDKAIFKARKLYSSIGVPAIADSLLFLIEPGGSHSQGYQFEQLDANVDQLLETLRTTSKPDRVTTFYSYVAYYDGERELLEEGICEVDIYLAHTSHASIAVSTAFDNLMLRLRTELHLPAYRPDDELQVNQNTETEDSSPLSKSKIQERNLPGAMLLADKLIHEADLLQDSLIKVTSFLNHQVDVSLMEACGKDLASLLTSTNPTKVLTIETSGLLPAIGVARELSLLMVYARHGKSITMSDCIHTFYRSQTKGELYELVISKEYLGENDRVVIIDDFLAGGSTLDALIRLAKMAGAEVCGIGVLIERTDMGGRAFLSGYNIPIFSLVQLFVSSEGLKIENIHKL